MKTNKKVNEIAQVLWDARKDKSVLVFNAKINKNGSKFDTFQGTVEGIKPTRDGSAVYTIKVNKSHEFQALPLNNVMMVRKGDVVYKR